LSLTPHEVNLAGGFFLYPRCHARAGGHLLAGPEPVTGRPRRTRGWRATTCEPGGGLPLHNTG